MIELSAGRFTGWQRSLIASNRGNGLAGGVDLREARLGQEELVAALHEGSKGLAAYLREQLGLVGQRIGDDLPWLPRQLTPEEAFEPPLQLESELHEAWSGVVPAGLASQPQFWVLCHIAWMEAGLLGDDLIATFTRPPSRSQAAGMDEGILEVQARTFLRHICGLPLVRGKISVFSDCPLARAWWRSRLAAEAAANAPHLSFADAHSAMHRRNQTWEELVQLLLRRLTVMNHPKARAALVAYIASTPTVGREELQSIAKACARYGLGHSLHHVSWDAVWRVIHAAAQS